MKKIEKLYEGNIRKKYFLFVLPLIISSLISTSYSFINSMMIGKILGSEVFAATAVTSSLIELLGSIFWGYLTGVGIYVSVLFGKNEYEKMINVIKFNYLLSFSLAALIAIICNVFCAEIFDILNVNDDIYDNAMAYFRTYVSGFVIYQFNWGFIYISHGMGLTKLPLVASTTASIINVILNYFFLAVLNKGIGYCALSSIISNIIILPIYICAFLKLFKSMGIKLNGINITKDCFTQSTEYGLPSMMQQTVMYICTAMVSPLTNTCTTAAIAGYAVANRSKSLITTIYQNSAKANTTLVAQAMGAGKIDKIKEGIKIGITQGLIFFGITLIGFMVFAKEFTALFLDPVKDAESIEVSVNIIRFLLPFLFFNLFNNLFHGIFRAVGSGKLMFISTLIYAVSYVIYANILFSLLPEEIKIYGVHLALSAAYITEMIFATFIFVTGKWKTKEYIVLEKKAVKSINNLV